MCLICDRIEMIKRGENPYFVKELETGYVVIISISRDIPCFYANSIKRSCSISIKTIS